MLMCRKKKNPQYATDESDNMCITDASLHYLGAVKGNAPTIYQYRVTQHKNANRWQGEKSSTTKTRIHDSKLVRVF